MKLRPIWAIISFLLLIIMMIGGIMIGVTADQANRARIMSNATTIGGCPLFPANNIWNRDISTLPVHRYSANFIASIGPTGHVHANFGAGLFGGGPLGIPYIVVPGNQPKAPISFTYSSESDPGPYPIPLNAPIEGGSQSSGDRHVIAVDSGTCNLYEMFAGYPQQNGSWKAVSGAVWNLNSNALRPSTWTSADAAGLPILPGLVRYDEVASGVITHALRFTVSRIQSAFLWPARHSAPAGTDPDPNLPPMGLRLRLKASVNISSFSPQNRVILTALKHYGMIVADNGSNWYISGAPDNRWNNGDLQALGNIPGSGFEVVDESSLQVNPNSAQIGTSPQPVPTKAVTVTSSPTVAIKITVISLFPQQATKNVLAEGPTKKDDNSRNTGNNAGKMNILLLSITVGVGILLIFVVIFWRRGKRDRVT